MNTIEQDYNYISFDVIKELWNIYTFEDGNAMKFKVVLLKIVPSPNVNEFAINTSNLMAVFAQQKTRGTPALPSPVPEIKIEKKDMPFNIKYEDWNEYKIEDGRILKLKPTIVEIIKTANYDQYGEPIYLVNCQILMKISA